MLKTSYKKQNGLRQAGVALVLTLVAAAMLCLVPLTHAEQDEQRAFGFSTGLVGIVPGQTARLALWNKGDQPVLTRLQFVDDQGKVLIQCDAIIQPGKSAVLEYGGFNGGVRTELQAQFGTNSKRSIGLLVPTVQITDGTSNATLWMIGQEGFTEFRPIFNPPLVAPW